jgi:hypothetical protein
MTDDGEDFTGIFALDRTLDDRPIWIELSRWRPGELYVPCPKCDGVRYVYAITRQGDAWLPTVKSEFPCDLCGMTGEADRAAAVRWMTDNAEEEEG